MILIYTKENVPNPKAKDLTIIPIRTKRQMAYWSNRFSECGYSVWEIYNKDISSITSEEMNTIIYKCLADMRFNYRLTHGKD